MAFVLAKGQLLALGVQLLLRQIVDGNEYHPSPKPHVWTIIAHQAD